jgi:adenosylmethionine-8-amino-7-oxononanoate aminotransferase
MCAAALEVQEFLKRDGLLIRVNKMGISLHQLLVKAFENRKYVEDIQGMGFFWGIKFVADKQSRASLPPSLGFGRCVVKRVFKPGLAVYPRAGMVDGVRGNHVLIVPEYNISNADLRKIMRILIEAYDSEEAKLDLSLGAMEQV